MRTAVFLGALIVGLVALQQPTLARGVLVLVTGVLAPIVLWWDPVRKLRGFSPIASIGAAIMLVSASWCLVTYGLVALGVPFHRLMAAFSLVAVNAVAYLAGFVHVHQSKTARQDTPSVDAR